MKKRHVERVGKERETERESYCLLLHPSVLIVQVEPLFTQLCMCVWRGGGRKKAERRREWGDGSREEGGQ